MSLTLRAGNVLEAQCVALLLTMDGAKRDLEGNIARAYSRLWPESFASVQNQVRYPVPLGRAVLAKRTDDWEEECPFSCVVMASTLHHLDVLDEQLKRRVIQSGFEDALTIARRLQLPSMATAVMKGGWRLSDSEALSVMLAVAGRQLKVPGCTAIHLFLTDAETLTLAAQTAHDAGVPFHIASR